MYVYLIGTEDIQKIGITNDLSRRLRELQTGNPHELTLHHHILVEDKDALSIEKKIHLELNHRKLKGEWFRMDREFGVNFLEWVRITWT